MNSLCKKVLKSLKKKSDDETICRLIDIILSCKCKIGTLPEDFLLQELQKNVDCSESNVNREPQDYRIKSIAFKNFRTFPYREEKPYGVSLSREDGEPISVLLVGKNGIGKSTVFDALEMIYAGRVKNAENRGISETDKLQEYLTFGFGDLHDIPKEEVELKIQFYDNTILGNDWIGLNEIPTLCVPALCCSDMDIEEISKLDEEVRTKTLPKMNDEGSSIDISETNFQKYIRCQLGIDELTELRDLLVKTSEYSKRLYDNVEKRLMLAELTSAEMTIIQGVFTNIVMKKSYQKGGWKKEIERFSKEEEIKTIKNEKDHEKFLRENITLFVDQWKELVKNIQNLQQQNQSSAESGNYLSEIEDNNKQTHLDNVINGLIVKLGAMYKRLEMALGTYMANKKDPNELFRAFMALANDYNFLVDYTNKLPVHAVELQELKKNTKKHQNAITLLILRLNYTLANIFPIKKDDDEDDDVNSRKCPECLSKFVQNILNYYQDETEFFEVTNTSNSFEVKINVNVKEGKNFITNPRKYLNTFRYRLYAVLLKIALSFYYMKSNHCVAPIIIDDVFNASDFENSLSLKLFVFHIIDIYQEVIGGNFPLQLIILTHDEMIASAFYQGMKIKSKSMSDREEKGIPRQEEYCIMGRLFPYKEAELLEKKTRTREDFQNLYLPINL